MVHTFSPKCFRLWDNVKKCGIVRQDTDGNIIRRKRFICLLSKATDIHWEYVILIVFPRQQWLGERASFLRLYIHSLPFLFSICDGTADWHHTLDPPSPPSLSVSGDTLALATFSRVLSHSKFLPWDRGRNAKCWNRLHWIQLGKTHCFIKLCVVKLVMIW